jgi:hypothetical protein
MSRSFARQAESEQAFVTQTLPELKGVDLTNPTAVEQAIAKAVAKKRTQNDINAAKDAIQRYNEAQKNVAKEAR